MDIEFGSVFAQAKISNVPAPLQTRRHNFHRDSQIAKVLCAE